MGRLSAALVGSLLLLGCDDATQADEADLDGLVEGAFGKSDNGTIEGVLGDAHTLTVTRKPAGAEPTSAHAKSVVFEVPQGEAFAVVMRDRSGALHPWLQLHDAEGLIATAQFGQGVVWDATNNDAVIFYRARSTTRFVAIAADQELAADGEFQLDLVPLASVPLDASQASPGMQAYLAAIRADDLRINARDTVVEDGMGRLEWTGDTPLSDRPAVNGTNIARDQYFAWLAEETGVAEESLRETIGGLWAELSPGFYRER